MWKLVGPAGEVRDGDLTVGQLVSIEALAGRPWGEVNPWRHASSFAACAAIAAPIVGLEPEAVRLSQFEPCKDDLPKMWQDGVPKGGQVADRWLPDLIRMGFTPRQVREEFTLRDIMLLAASR